MEALGYWPTKEIKCGVDNWERPHFVRLMELKGIDGKDVASVQCTIGNSCFKPRDREIEQDSKGKFVSLFGGLKFYFDDVQWKVD